MKRHLLFFIIVLTLSQLTSFGQFRKSRDKATVTPAPTTDPSVLNYAKPAEYFVGGIEITGLQVLDKNAMISLTGLKVGDKIKIPGDAITGAIRKLWKHGLVGDVSILVDRIEGQNVFLIVHLAERPRLTDYYFTGISKGRQTSLKDDLKLIRGKIVNDASVRNAELSVRKHFVKKGFLNTAVKISPEQDSLNRGGIRLRIDVDLKSKVRINEIQFDGNENIASGKLKKQFKKTHEHARVSLHRTLIKGILNFRPRQVKEFFDSSYKVTPRDMKEFLNKNVKLNFFAGSKFIKSEFDDDKNRLIEYYNTQGFRDADLVTDTIVKYGSNAIDVKIKVDEGKKYYFRNITWAGNFVHNVNTLNRILDIKKGDIYNNELILKKTAFNPKGADISGLYMDDGYLFFRVVPVEVAVEGDSIDVEMRISEGDQATIDEVIISGNDRTSDHVVRRELSTIPGQKFRRSDIIRTQQQLSQMGFFNPQKIEQDIRPNPSNGTVNIEWRLQEQSNDQVELSGGWGGYYGFVGTVGLAFNNFSLRNVPHLKKWRPLPVGDGQKLSIRAQANGQSYQSYTFSFTEPWLGGKKPNSLTVSLNHSVSRQPYGYTSSNTLDYSNPNAPSLQQTGITIGLGRRLEWPDSYFVLTNSMSFLVYDYRNYFGAPLPKIGQSTSIKLNTTLSRNSIDNPMYPTSGSTISLSLDLTPPYSLFRNHSYLSNPDEAYKFIELHKWMFDAKYYIKIFGSKKPEGRSLVLETKAHFGYIGTYSSDVGPGPFERYLMGGAGLAGGFNSYVLGQDIIGLRGYQDNLVTPPLYSQRGTRQVNGIEGGTIYNKFGMELRYPVTTGQTATIYALMFTEAGNNWNNIEEFNPFNLYKSAGFGARIFMPAFGLIGLNWGYGFDKLPGATNRSGAQFHFTIGQQIR